MCLWLVFGGRGAALYAQDTPLQSVLQPNSVLRLADAPASVQLGQRRWQAGLQLSVWQGSTMFGFRETHRLYRGAYYTQADVDVLIERADPGGNHIALGASATPLALAWRPKADSKHSFSFDWTERAGAHIAYKRELLELLLKGNADLLGDTLPAGPMTATAMHLRQFALGWHYRVFSRPASIGTLDIAIRPKLILGQMAAETRDADARFLFGESGSRIQVDFDYQLNTAGVGAYGFGQAKGYGGGVDVGFHWQLPRDFNLSLHALDVGGVRFSQDVAQYAKSGTQVFTGLDLEAIFDPESGALNTNDPLNFDTLTNAFTPEQSQPVFATSLPTRLQLAFNKRMTTGDKAWQHTYLGLVYTQGLINSAWSSTRPQVALLFAQDFTRWLSVGGQLQFGGFNEIAGGLGARAQLGAHTALMLSFPNLSGVINPENGTGFAAQFGLSVGF